MKLTATVLLVCSLAPLGARAAEPDAVFNAMQAEMKRSMTLSLNQLDRPYYITYSVDDEHSYSASATLGGLLSSNSGEYRIPGVRVRVGDYKFDNTNWTGANASGPRYDLRSFPLEDDPLVVRQYLWLATDSIFKGSLQSIARKRAALKSVTVTDQMADFAAAPAFVRIEDYAPVKFDQPGWAEKTRRISAVFTEFPTLRTSSAEFTAIDALHRFINSEGTQIRLPETAGLVELRATAQAPDGMIVRDVGVFYTHDIRNMFSEADLTKSARQIGEQVVKLAAAPIGDNYTGPVLFEGVASAQLMAEVLGRNLHISRKPVSAPGAPSQTATTDLEGRRGVRIMPEFFDVTDDPAQPLFGHEEADDEGVPGKALSLVEKGVLKDFLRTRLPVRGYSDSNGRARLAGNYGASTPVPTNLMIHATETSTIDELKKKLIDLCQQRGLPYGIIVRKMDFPSSASLDEARKLLSGAGGSGHPVSMPLYTYRLYLDGHEELVRGERFRGINARSLKDILAAGDDKVTFNYLENGAPFALLGFGGSSAEVSVVAPSVLIDDLEMSKVDDELPKLPIVPSPLTGIQTASAR
ncbi:MAG TPA: metallopeptidase TldD-related protein [Bryobacteraceae bacterium]|nr:metallopeptidase TldD-related protein [Bryobacteraceae bacterium]